MESINKLTMNPRLAGKNQIRPLDPLVLSDIWLPAKEVLLLHSLMKQNRPK